MRKLSLLILLLISGSAGAATPPFKYDRQLAIDLARAYVQWSIRSLTGEQAVQIDYNKLEVVAIVDRDGRKLVSVTFPTTTGASGGYALLERCEETGLLVAADVGTVSNLENYRQGMDSVNAKTYLAVPRVCPPEEAP